MAFLYLHSAGSQQKLSDDIFQLDGTVLLFVASPFLPAFSMCTTALVHQSSLVFLPALLSGVWVRNTFLFRTSLLSDKGYLTV